MREFEIDYARRLEALKDRRTAPVQVMAKQARYAQRFEEEASYRASPVFEVYERIAQGSSVKYSIGAMQRVDPKYTEVTYGEAARVTNQLSKAYDECDHSCEFDYQGSVTNDTHIKSYSDIDILSITGRYTTLEPPQKPAVLYDGDPISDLRQMRSAIHECLSGERLITSRLGWVESGRL